MIKINDTVMLAWQVVGKVVSIKNNLCVVETPEGHHATYHIALLEVSK